MIAAAALAAATLAPSEIFARAQAAWRARAVPAYLSFQIPCSATFASELCVPDAVAEFVVRMSDGRTFARSLASSKAPSKVLLRGGFISGPAETPLGFYRRIGGPAAQPSPPPNLAPDPFAPPTIASVTSVARFYEISLLEDVQLGTYRCYHLALRPLLEPLEFPLRELWVDETSFQIVQLTYARALVGETDVGTVQYRFAPVGPASIWAIVHIEAVLPHGARSHVQVARLSQDLQSITFPSSEPEDEFAPAP